MSFYNYNGGNRIPKDSVTISDEKYLIKVQDIIPEELLTTQEKQERVKKTELQLKEEELRLYEKQLRRKEEELKIRLADYEQEKSEFLQRFRNEEEEYERKKRQEYYDMREFMWENALLLAEKVVGQKIKANDFSMENMFTNLLKNLPIAFEELTVTINPETLDVLNGENSKSSWMLKNINWKFDYSMQLGEFIVEDEKEFYDYRFESIFAEVKNKIEQRNKDVRSGEE